ncbi:MAG: hypothetical protein IPK16_08900 [Anaerolineales bacterium]|nr:hypothetical protein [Anaerolineales bacterium]
MKLTGQQIRQIQDALLGGFDRDGLRMFVRIRLNEELDAITHNDNLTVVVFDLIGWANQQGRLGDLIRTAAEERPANAGLQQLVKDYAQWEVTAAKDVTIGGNPQAVFSEAYRLQMAGELTRAQILYKEIENEPSLRLAVAEQLRAIDDELKHSYVDDHGVVNPELVIAGNPLPPIPGYAGPEGTPKSGKSWLRPMAASLATLLLVGGTAVVAMQQPAVREAAQQFAAALFPHRCHPDAGTQA